MPQQAAIMKTSKSSQAQAKVEEMAKKVEELTQAHLSEAEKRTVSENNMQWMIDVFNADPIFSKLAKMLAASPENRGLVESEDGVSIKIENTVEEVVKKVLDAKIKKICEVSSITFPILTALQVSSR